MATPLQIAANQRNAQLSKGPVTAAGKEASRANVTVKHGLAGQGLVLADDIVKVVDERAAFWAHELGAVTEADKLLAYQIATEQVRIVECQKQEVKLARLQARRAVGHWDVDEAFYASEIAKGLKKQPESVALDLERTSHGCDLKIARWEELISLLKADRPWNTGRVDAAFDLLGVIPVLRDLECPRFGTTADEQGAFARAQVAKLKKRKADCLDEMSELRREHAAAGYAFPDRSIWLVRRYEAGCNRRLNQHLAKLVGRSQSAPKASPPPPPDAAPWVESEAPEPEPVNLIFDEKDDLAAFLAQLGDLPAMTVAEAEARLNGPLPDGVMTEEEQWEWTRLDAMALALVQADRAKRPQPPAGPGAWGGPSLKA